MHEAKREKLNNGIDSEKFQPNVIYDGTKTSFYTTSSTKNVVQFILTSFIFTKVVSGKFELLILLTWSILGDVFHYVIW